MDKRQGGIGFHQIAAAACGGLAKTGVLVRKRQGGLRYSEIASLRQASLDFGRLRRPPKADRKDRVGTQL
jgi:hypothetical protein